MRLNKKDSGSGSFLLEEKKKGVSFFVFSTKTKSLAFSRKETLDERDFLVFHEK